MNPIVGTAGFGFGTRLRLHSQHLCTGPGSATLFRDDRASKIAKKAPCPSSASPARSSREEPRATGPRPHRVRNGESWKTLADHYGIPASTIILANFETLDPAEILAWPRKSRTSCSSARDSSSRHVSFPRQVDTSRRECAAHRTGRGHLGDPALGRVSAPRGVAVGHRAAIPRPRPRWNLRPGVSACRAGHGLDEVLTAPRAPRQNPFVERVIGLYGVSASTTSSCGTSSRSAVTSSSTSPTIATGAPTSRWTRIHRRPGRTSRPAAARSSKSRTSADCITTTNVAPPDRRAGVTDNAPTLCVARCDVLHRTAAVSEKAVPARSGRREPRPRRRRPHVSGRSSVQIEFLVGTKRGPIEPARQLDQS